MELMRCFELGCSSEAEFACSCTSPETLSCELHVMKHMKLTNNAHAFDSIFKEPCEETKEAIISFLAEKVLKNTELKGKILESFSQCVLESKNQIEKLLKILDSDSVEISNYFTKIAQTRKISKSEEDPVLGLLILQPDEAVEKLKMLSPAFSDWDSEKLFCGFSEKIEEIFGYFYKFKFSDYLDKILFSIERTIEMHNKIVNEEHKKIITLMTEELANIKESLAKLIKEDKNSDWDWEKIKLKYENKMDTLNNGEGFNEEPNKALKSQKILQELIDKRAEILNKPNDPKLEQDFRKTCSKYGKNACNYDPPLQQAYQDYINAYRQKTSLFTIIDGKNLHVYDTENESKEIRQVNASALGSEACIAQLPNGNLFCFKGRTLIIDENYKVQELPSEYPCSYSSAIYFNNHVYCFGGEHGCTTTLSSKFDLNESLWIELNPMPGADKLCTCAIFNGNILISGMQKYLFRYIIGRNEFKTIPYNFKAQTRKILISSERAYLIECYGSVYESEVSNDNVWRPIGDSIISDNLYQVYLTYNNGGINIAGHIGGNGIRRYKFNLQEKILTVLS